MVIEDGGAQTARRAAASQEPGAEEADRGRSVVADATERERELALLHQHGVDPADPDLQQEIRKIAAGATDELPYGQPGPPLARSSPFAMGFFAALGALAAVALGWAIVAAGPVLVLVGVSLFLAVGLNPLVVMLQHRGISRRLAVAVVATGLALSMVAFATLAVPPLFRQANTLRERAPDYAAQLAGSSPAMADLDRRFDLVQRLEGLAAEEELLDEEGEEQILDLAQGAAAAAAATLTALVLTVYFLASLPHARVAAERLVPRSRRARAGLLTEGVLERIGGYVLGKVVTAVIAGLGALVVLALLGVPHSIALAIFVAVTSVIPLIGATIGAVVAAGVAFTVSVSAGLIAIAFFVVYQQIENFWLIPRVMKETVDVSPAATLVAALVGGALFGIVGALLAIPVAAAVKLVIEQVVVPAQEGR